MNASIFKQADIQYLKTILLDTEGIIQVVPFSSIRNIPQEHISQFCVEEGFYVIPTLELIEFLREEIGDNKAIEIGAGHGKIAEALGIPATDNFMQRRPAIKAHYDMLRQAIVPYGKHVYDFDALEAVRKWKPHTVVAAYCTHKYNEREHWREGNMFGIEEHKILNRVKKYIHVGNERVHKLKPILSQPHREIKAEWLITRSLLRGENVIWIWEP